MLVLLWIIGQMEALELEKIGLLDEVCHLKRRAMFGPVWISCSHLTAIVCFQAQRLAADVEGLQKEKQSILVDRKVRQ